MIFHNNFDLYNKQCI